MSFLCDLYELEQICGGRLYNTKGDEKIKNIVINDKQVEENSCFATVSGKRFNGSEFLDSAFARGASAAVVSRAEEINQKPCLLVPDVCAALEKAAAHFRMRNIKTMYSVTGSVGKTTVKEMIASILSEMGSVVKTKGNHNNLLGVPLTLLNGEKADIGVIEAGISEMGEMDRLGAILRPDIAVITNVENMHLLSLKDKNGVAREKKKLLDHIRMQGRAVLNYDSELLRGFLRKDVTVLYFSKSSRAAFATMQGVRTYKDRTVFDVCFQTGQTYRDICIPLLGEHNAYNAVCAITAVYGKASENQIRCGLMKYSGTDNRQRVIKCKNGVLFCDAYNAGPVSCAASLDVYKLLCDENNAKKRVIVLGSMLELGDKSIAEHIKLGKKTAEISPDMLICYGSEAREIAYGASKCGMPKNRILCFDSSMREEIKKAVLELFGEGVFVLIKGSRALKMEEIAEYVRDNCK